MRNFNTNNVEANRGICQGVNVFAIDTYVGSACDCLRLLSSGLWAKVRCALATQTRWQMVPSVVKPIGGTTGTGRRQAMQPSQSMARTPARLG